MQPVRLIYEDAPAFIPVPPDFQHHRVEVTLWPLEENTSADQEKLANAVGTAELIRGLEAAQYDAMARLWDNDSDEVWNHVERL